MAEKEKALVLDKSYPVQGEYVTFPGMPGRYLGGQAVPLSQLGLSLEDARERIKDGDLPLREANGEALDDVALYGDTTSRVATADPDQGLQRSVGRYPGLSAEESDARDAEQKERRQVVNEQGMTVQVPEATRVDEGEK